MTKRSLSSRRGKTDEHTRAGLLAWHHPRASLPGLRQWFCVYAFVRLTVAGAAAVLHRFPFSLRAHSAEHPCGIYAIVRIYDSTFLSVLQGSDGENRCCTAHKKRNSGCDKHGYNNAFDCARMYAVTALEPHKQPHSHCRQQHKCLP